VSGKLGAPYADCEVCKELNDDTKLCEQCAVTFALASSYLDLGSDLGIRISGDPMAPVSTGRVPGRVGSLRRARSLTFWQRGSGL
jgi:hypothetical protein